MRFEIELPDKRRLEVDAPNQQAALQGIQSYLGKSEPKQEGPGLLQSLYRGAVKGLSGIASASGSGNPLMQKIAASRQQKLLEGTQPATSDLGRMTETMGEYVAPGILTGAGVVPSVLAGLGAGVAREAAPGSQVAELAGAAAGALGPSGAVGLTRTFLRGGGAKAKALNQAVKEAEVAGLPTPLPATTGGLGTKATRTLYSKIPGGIAESQRGVERIEKGLETAVDRLTSSLSTKPLTSEYAGRTIKRGIEGFSDKFRQKANTLYSKADAVVPTDAPVELGNTVSQLQKFVGRSELTQAFESPTLRKAVDAVLETNGQVPFQELKRLRSMVGYKLSGGGLIGDIGRGELKQLYGALSEDLKNAALRHGGDKGLQAYERANRYWKAGIERVDDFLDKLANKVEPEKIYDSLVSGAKAGPTKLRTVKQSLKPEEWDTVAATMIDKLGRSIPSRSGVHQFDIETFVTRWNQLNPSSRNVLLSGGRYANTRGQLDRIVKFAEEHKDALTFLKNRSETAAGVLSGGYSAAVGAAVVSGHPLPAVGILAGMGVNKALTALMHRPGGIKWLARLTKVPAKNFVALLPALRKEAENDPQLIPAFDVLTSQLNGTNQTGAQASQGNRTTPSPSGAQPLVGPTGAPPLLGG